MKVLIIGGRSRLAKYVIQRLPREWSVLTLGRKGCDINADFVEDFTLPITEFDAAVYLAAAYNDSSKHNFSMTHRVNVEAPVRILKKLNSCSHFVYVSSIFANLEESSPFYSDYSNSKRQGELQVYEECKKQNIGLTTLRPGQFYSSDLSYKEHQPFLFNILNTAITGADHTLYGTHDPKRNYIHVEDFAEIMKRVIERNIVGSFDCLHPKNSSYIELMQIANSISNSKSNIKLDENMDNVPDNIFPINNELYQKIGFYPKITKTEAFEKIANIMREKV